MTARVPSGVWSLGANPVPPVLTTSPAKPSVMSVRAAATLSVPSATTCWSTTANPFAASNSASAAPLASTRVPAITPSDTVSTFAASRSSVMPRRYRAAEWP